jgi:hypothetical protein
MLYVKTVLCVQLQLLINWRRQGQKKNFRMLSSTTHSMMASGLIYDEGCQMVYFKTKNTKLGIFWRA